MSTDQEYPPLEFPGWLRTVGEGGWLQFHRRIGGRTYSYREGNDRPTCSGSIINDVPGRCYDRLVAIVIGEIEAYALAEAEREVEKAKADLEKIKKELGR